MRISLESLTSAESDKLSRMGYVIEIDGDDLFANVYKPKEEELDEALSS